MFPPRFRDVLAQLKALNVESTRGCAILPKQDDFEEKNKKKTAENRFFRRAGYVVFF